MIHMTLTQKIALLEAESVISALFFNASVSAAARTLGISRFALIRLMEKHNIEKSA